MNIAKLLDVKIDYVFKRIFGQVGNEKITLELIKSITKEPIKEIELDNKRILEKDLLDDKIGILDIRAKIGNEINCNIEMQIVDQKNIEKRILYYWSKMYSMGIKEGKNYDKLKKGIEILICDFEIDNLKEIPKYITKWNIREEEYCKKILTEVMEIYIIEMPKFEKNNQENKNEQLNLWMKFIKNPEVIEMEEKENNKETIEAIKEAKKVLEKISQDEREQYLAELRLKHIMDTRAVEDGAYEKGIKVGIEKLVKKMKKENISIETIIKISGLTKEEIENL